MKSFKQQWQNGGTKTLNELAKYMVDKERLYLKCQHYYSSRHMCIMIVGAIMGIMASSVAIYKAQEQVTPINIMITVCTASCALASSLTQLLNYNQQAAQFKVFTSKCAYIQHQIYFHLLVSEERRVNPLQLLSVILPQIEFMIQYPAIIPSRYLNEHATQDRKLFTWSSESPKEMVKTTSSQASIKLKNFNYESYEQFDLGSDSSASSITDIHYQQQRRKSF